MNIKVNINYNKLSIILIIIFTIFCFFIITTQPLPVCGEYETYTLTTMALQYEHTIYFSEKTFENYRKHFPDYYKNLAITSSAEYENFGRSPKKNGEIVKVSFYFPAYSASCIPVSMVLEILGLNQSYTFVFTNILLFIVALFVVYKLLKVNDKTKFILLLTLSINPIIYYLSWPSAEVFMYTFVVISLVFFFNKAYKRSAFLLTIAGSLNITIMALGIFMIIIFFIDLQKEKGNGKNIIVTIYNNKWVIIEYAASFSFIFLAFIYNYAVSGNFLSTVQSAAAFDIYWFGRFFAYSFDLNFGLFPWFPFIFLLYIAVIVLTVLKLKYHYFLLAAGHICVTMAFSLMYHINCGMSGIHRYNVWIAPVMLFITVIFLFEEIISIGNNNGFLLKRIIPYHQKIIASLIILSNVFTIFILLAVGFRPFEHYNYVTMQHPARFILDRVPAFYNPLYSTFISRVEHRDGGYNYKEPVFYFDSRPNHYDEIRKILIRRNEKANIKDFLTFANVKSKVYFESKLNRISNTGNEFVYLNIPPRYDIEKYLPPIEFNKELLFGIGYYDNIYLSNGFSYQEISHVWTNQKEAKIKIPIQMTKLNLKLIIHGGRLTPSQTVNVEINDKIYGELEDGENEFIIKADELINQNYLIIKIITSNVYTPKELGINSDDRTLGFALQAIDIYKINDVE
jgi:hypothetical protein